MPVNRKTFAGDLIAGLTMALYSIPDSMATAMLAGISPLTGVYTMIFAPPIGALFTSSVFMRIEATSTIALIISSSLPGISPGERLPAVFMLAVIVGAIQIGMGLLKMGFLVRFVPHSVLTGFLNGVGVVIILGQLSNFTGFSSTYHNKILQAFDTILNYDQIIIPTILIGLATILLIVVLGKIKSISKFSLVIAMFLASVLVFLPYFSQVPTAGTVTEVTNALPGLVLPQFSLFFKLLVPALSISIIGLVMVAGISQSFPNPDGKFPNPSGDLFGQGMANVASGLFQGMPVSGAVSGTAMNISAGAKTRWANIFMGVLIALIILLFAGVVKMIALPALAGLLVVVGFQMIKPANLIKVWQTSQIDRAVMLITFIGTLIMPLHYAVLLGVAIAIVLQISQQANRVRLVELVPVAGGFPIEQDAPRDLPSHKMTVLFCYGNLFYAAAKTMEEDLPKAEEAKQAVVIFLLGGQDEFGSTTIEVFERYLKIVQDNRGQMMLAGISETVKAQFERTGFIKMIGRENIFLAQKQWGASYNQAILAARSWLAEHN